MNNQKSQYEAVCDNKDCEQILDINEHIHIWDNSIGDVPFTDEVTICRLNLDHACKIPPPVRKIIPSD